MISYKDSVALAKKLKDMSPLIKDIELFGSVLRNGSGRDADFLILVDDQLAKRWWHEQQESIRVRWPDILHRQLWIIKKFIPFIYTESVRQRRRKRLQFFEKMLGIKLAVLADSAGNMPDFEVFLMPSNWRIGTELNINLMRQITDLSNDQNTLGFFKRIAKYAINVTKPGA
jgi:hypothetical protein